ncbi:hypothetical protein SAMN04487846_0626 [Microbacterium sp. cf046]|nr:hypothetical protein SAMN04487846_0626 [Microbacterium sp. cf046]
MSFGVANHLTAAAVVLPFICVAFGGSAFAAALIFPIFTGATLLGAVLAPRVLGLRPVARSLALILALIAIVFAITAVGILVVSPDWLNALWIVAAIVGLLSGVASIAVVEVMSSALATSEKAALSVVQSTGGAILTLVITIVLGLFFLDPDGRDAHLALLWVGIVAMLVAALSLLRIRPAGDAPVIPQHSIGILDALKSRPDRKHPWVREFLITQVLFLSIALGTSFYSVHGATLHGQESEALHYIVAVTAVGSLLFTAVWTLSRRKATIRGLLLTAAALGVFAAVAALIADYSGAEALPILSGVVIVFAAAGGAATSSTRSTWMYHNLGTENDTEIIIFCQIVLGVTATAVGLGLSLLARLDTVLPAWVMLVLSAYALFHARRGPRVRILDIRPGHEHNNHGRHFGGFHW